VAIDWSRLRSLTARELINSLQLADAGMVLHFAGRTAAIGVTYIPTGEELPFPFMVKEKLSE
jgi:hypothetical protein